MTNDHIHHYLDFLRPRVAPRVFRDYKTSLTRMKGISTLEELDQYVAFRSGAGGSRPGQEDLSSQLHLPWQPCASVEKASGKTINNELCAFKGWVRWALGRGIVLSPKLLEYPPLKHSPLKRRRPLTPEEIRELLAVSGRHREWWAFLILTGLRRSEFESLTWEDIDLGKGVLVVRDAKDKARWRVVPLHTKVAQILRTRWRKDIEGRVFKDLPANPLRAFKRDLEKAGINSGIDLHCLRVTFVTGLARVGEGPRTAQELAGHRDLRTTLSIYTKVESSDKVRAIAKLRPW